MLLNDKQIIERCVKQKMIRPFEESKVRRWQGFKVISFGAGGHGYDIRLSEHNIKVFQATGRTINPKRPDERFFVEPTLLVDDDGQFFELPAHTYCLAQTVERFNIPPDIFGMAVGKSTYARCGQIANITPLEAGWHGILTLEINNNAPDPVRLYVNEGIAQIIFFQVQPPAQGTYSGAYQHQEGTTLAMVE